METRSCNWLLGAPPTPRLMHTTVFCADALCNVRVRRTAQLAAHADVEVRVQVLQPLPVAARPWEVAL